MKTIKKIIGFQICEKKEKKKQTKNILVHAYIYFLNKSAGIYLCL